MILYEAALIVILALEIVGIFAFIMDDIEKRGKRK